MTTVAEYINEQYTGQLGSLDRVLSHGRKLEDDNQHDKAQAKFELGYQIHKRLKSSSYHRARANDIVKKYGLSW